MKITSSIVLSILLPLWASAEKNIKGRDLIDVVVREIGFQQTAVFGVNENQEERFLFDENIKVSGLNPIGIVPPPGKIAFAELSPDHKKVLFAVIPRAGSMDWIGVYRFEEGQAIYLRNAFALEGSWHPNSCWIAFTSDSGDVDINICIMDTCRIVSSVTYITPDTFHKQGFHQNTKGSALRISNPRWSEDGESLYFQARFQPFPAIDSKGIVNIEKTSRYEEWKWDIGEKKLERQ